MDYLKMIVTILFGFSPFAFLAYHMWKEWKISKAQKERHKREIQAFRDAANQILEADRLKQERRKRGRTV